MNDPQRRSDINIVLAAALLLFGFIWLIAYATGGTDVIAQTIRPYLPSWFPIVNLLMLPITCVLAGLHAINFRLGTAFVVIFAAQLALLAFPEEKYKAVRVAVVILL
jgi:hypothetical protein